MSLAKRQRDRALELALQALLRRGTPPDQGEVDTQFKEELPPILGEPFFQLREQRARGQFDVEWQNAMFREAGLDLSMLYAENVDVVEMLLSHLALAEVSGRRMGLEIRALQSLLEDLLLTSTRGTNFFHTVSDRFNDLSQIDQTQSDVAVDLTSGLVTLTPEASTRRIPLPHLLSQVSPSMAVLTPVGATSRLIPGSTFGNAFEDLLTAWQQQILTPTQGPVEIAITIPIIPALDRGAPERVSRITLHNLSATPFTVMPYWARDGVAFSRFANVTNPIVVDADEDVTVIDVTPQLVTAIQLRFRKTGPDGEEELGGTRLFSTVFAFRQIGFWSMGHKRHGTLVSLALSPQDAADVPNIGKVSLTVDEILPAETTIRYEVASSAAPTQWRPITPLSRPEGEFPKVVDFNTVQRSARDANRIQVDAATPPISLGRIRGNVFYGLSNLNDTPIFGSAKLWRGLNSWHQKRSTQSTIHKVQNLYIDFANADTQRLYVFEDQERIPTHGANTAADTALQIETRYPVLLDSDTFQPGQDLFAPSDPTRPNYSIRKLLRRPVAGTLSQTNASGALTLTARSQSASVQSTSQQTTPTQGRLGAKVKIANFASAALIPAPTDGSGPIPDLFDMPFRLQYTVNSVLITGVFTILAAQLESGGDLLLTLDDPTELIRDASGSLSALVATWEMLTVDITRSITSVIGNKVTLSQTQKIATTDLLEISYRRALVNAELPITASLVVRKSTTGTEFIQGVDYSIDLGTRTITRIPTGSIGTGSDQASQAVRVDFEYEAQLLGLVVYRTFVFNPEPTSALLLAKITVDRENGEEVLFETAGGFLDLHNRDQLPAIPAGWHQIVVTSNPIRRSDGLVDKTSAVYKALNLKEIRSATDTGRFLWPAVNHPDAVGATTDKFAPYFLRQTAFLTPMTQVTWSQLTDATRATDKGVFAIKGAAESPATPVARVAINYDPQALTDTDLLYFPPDITGSGIPLARADFELEYASVISAAAVLNALYLRATFDRSPDSETGVTPILKAYTLRLSY